MFFVGENLWAKGGQKLFGQVWGIRAKILRTPKTLPAPTPMAGCHHAKLIVFLARSLRAGNSECHYTPSQWRNQGRRSPFRWITQVDKNR